MAHKFIYGSIILDPDVVMTTNNNSINVNGSIDRDPFTAGTLTLITGSGSINLGGNIGTGVNGALGTLTLNTSSTSTLGGTVNTLASQSLQQRIWLMAAV